MSGPDLNEAILAALMLAISALYASVGNAGASGYLAAMSLFGMAPETMKPAALALNIVVASISSYKYLRAGLFSWYVFLPAALPSVPLAYIGGHAALPEYIYKPLVGAFLLYSAYMLIRSMSFPSVTNTVPPSLPLLAVSGSLIGLLSGLTGVGGGIFLSPLLILMGWAEPRQTSGVASLFILVNSAAALLGTLGAGATLSPVTPLWIAAVGLGGFAGAELGSKHLQPAVIKTLLSALLLIAGAKMTIAAF